MFNVPRFSSTVVFSIRYLATPPRRPVLVGAHRSNPIYHQRLRRGPLPPEVLEEMTRGFRRVEKTSGTWKTYGCFRKWWYPQIIHFNKVFHYKPSVLGLPLFFGNIHMNPYLSFQTTGLLVLGIKSATCFPGTRQKKTYVFSPYPKIT